MSDNDPNPTLRIAQSLLGHLVEPVNGELKDLLDSAEKGIPISRDINTLLYKYENVRVWMDEQISIKGQTKGSELRGYGTLPGYPNIVSASQKWICPKNKCDHWMLMIQEGEDPPICEKHHLEMVRRGDGRGNDHVR